MKYLIEAAFFFIYAAEADSINIKEMGFHMSGSLAVVSLGCLLIMWNMMFSIRKSCMEKTVYEAAFYLLPIELFLLIEFAQYHILITGMIIVLLVTSPFLVMNQIKIACMKQRIYGESGQEADDQEIREQALRTMHQWIILCASIILAVPSFIALAAL